MGAAIVLPIVGAIVLYKALQKPPALPVPIPPKAPPQLPPDASPKPPGGVEAERAEQERKEELRRMKMIEDARNAMGIDCVSHYNFAVCGQSGTGKSSFINAIRGITDKHPDAAKVGIVETTQEVKKYSHHELKHAFVWDLPGAGTMKHPEATYFEDKRLYAFDCLFILSSDRFFDVDMKVAKSALDHQKPIAFVRTKADVAIKNLFLNEGLTAKEASELFRSTVVANFQDNLKRAGLSNQAHKIPLFMIANTFFKRPKTYTFFDDENETFDKSLEKMDEDKIYKFMETSLQSRFRQ